MEYALILFSIVIVNLLLSGDNALVIALASRNLPPQEQRQALFWGSAGAVGLRIALTFVAVELLRIPYLQMVGGLLLLWIAAKLVVKDKDTEEITSARGLGAAIRTIIAADMVMSLDNIIAIVGVSHGNLILLIVGLAISIPIIVWGSKLIGYIIHKWPIIILVGGAFLGWTAGGMVVADHKIAAWITGSGLEWLNTLVPAAFAALVLAMGVFFAGGGKEEQPEDSSE